MNGKWSNIIWNRDRNILQREVRRLTDGWMDGWLIMKALRGRGCRRKKYKSNIIRLRADDNQRI